MLFFNYKDTIVPVKYCIGPSLFRINEINIPQLPINSTYQPSLDLQQYLQGRKLLLDEIPFELEIMHEHFENGYVRYESGVTLNKGLYVCGRCGNKDPKLMGSFSCARCFKACRYCRKCVTMGRVSECTPLVSWAGSFVPFQYNDPLVWDGVLSEGQSLASNQVVKAIETQSEHLLVWAVCGAGKTEVLFEGICTALKSGKYICIATPRTDVVIELAPRIKQVFPDIEMTALYGGSEDNRELKPLTLATTHQLLRFEKAFDVMIIDEVDAYPYSYDEMLQRAVRTAKKAMCTTIYLTATPNKQWQKEVERGKLQCVKIPARYHGHPLPVPAFKWCGNWKKQLAKKKIPTPIKAWFREKLSQDKQSFLFVPSIELLESLIPLLEEIHPEIETVHSQDPLRKEKVSRFRKGEIPILVTTTILERGVTVPNTDVAVFGADDHVFTESALVQISGRVGRSAKFPAGETIFFHFGKTSAMEAAKVQIEKMNKLAMEQGLIKEV
ncbi:DEAD/DEAH box helicase [Bacillus suaedaesalsae]|uniref:DEAD/DEAH box helicase n=1 Tax=Bacillus suaedaesalsae TaxID=2810349 RepID=A0ABS2DLV6_9BACI|nr:DEAD/DEAH box helicase [Bacillus suaedaesalsae]MBM6619050.1 DEAD/DEAH box helicase [Bacillus suaedaesalsae]